MPNRTRPVTTQEQDAVNFEDLAAMGLDVQRPAPPPQEPQQMVPLGHRQRVRVVPFDPRTGILYDEVFEVEPEVTPDGKIRELLVKIKIHALLDDGRICVDLGNFNMSPFTGFTYTNASGVECPGCGCRCSRREVSPSFVNPDMLVCPDCIQRGI